MKTYNFEFTNSKITYLFSVKAKEQYSAFERARTIVEEALDQRGELSVINIQY